MCRAVSRAVPTPSPNKEGPDSPLGRDGHYHRQLWLRAHSYGLNPPPVQHVPHLVRAALMRGHQAQAGMGTIVPLALGRDAVILAHEATSPNRRIASPSTV